MVKPTDAGLLISGGLTNIFFQCDACLPDEEFNRLHQHELSEKESHIHQGLLGGSVSGVMERGAIASNLQSKQAQNHKSQKDKTARFIELVEQIRASIEQMEADIKALEDLFEKRDGDAWREKLALNILDADDIPQQESGETIQAYRERLEKHLINEMLNPDGTIKDKYKNDLKYSDYAEWVQKQYNLNNAKAIAAELDGDTTSPQRREQILDEMKERGYIEEMTYASKAEDSSVTSQAAVLDVHDEYEDKASERVISADAAMKFNS